MNPIRWLAAIFAAASLSAAQPKLKGVHEAMESMIRSNEVAGAVTMVVSKDKVLHSDSAGFADAATRKKMSPDTLFWIASMTKPITGAALLILQDEGKLKVTDPVAKYIPEFANLKTPSGKPANLTIVQLMNHTSGLGEAPREQAMNARELSDLVPLWLAAPMQYEPGAKWSYTQSGINAGGRVVEIVSGMRFDQFLEKRLFKPLGMKNTTFYPDEKARKNLATAYAKKDNSLEPVAPRPDYGPKDRPPQGNGGLYSTPEDYARFCQMLLGNGKFKEKKILSEEAMRHLNTPNTGDMPTGFFQNAQYGNRGLYYGWGVGACIVKLPHEGVANVLSPGTFGHGGAWGTQAWVDPAKGIAYVLMVQRANFPNSDASEVRRAFQDAAAAALGHN